MKKFLLAAAILGAVVPAMAQTNVSISVGQPGFYGRIDLGGYAPPPVVYAQPVVVERVVRYQPQTVYLRVPIHEQRNWRRYCNRYGACGQRVFFVRDDWYLNTYAPRYREVHYRGGRHDNGWHNGHDRDHDGRGDHGRDHDDRGRGDDHGRGHDNGHGRGHDRH